jgi:hypothetical protein
MWAFKGNLGDEETNSGPSTRIGAFHAPMLAQDDIRFLLAQDDKSIVMRSSDSQR